MGRLSCSVASLKWPLKELYFLALMHFLHFTAAEVAVWSYLKLTAESFYSWILWNVWFWLCFPSCLCVQNSYVELNCHKCCFLFWPIKELYVHILQLSSLTLKSFSFDLFQHGGDVRWNLHFTLLVSDLYVLPRGFTTNILIWEV